MGRTRSWKVLKWKVRNEIEKIEVEKFGRSTKVRGEVGKFELKLETGPFQLRLVLSNFAEFLPTSFGSFQHRLALSNLNRNFPTKNFSTSRSFQLPFPTSCILSPSLTSGTCKLRAFQCHLGYYNHG